MESKFFDIYTEEGLKTVNVNNIAIIESVDGNIITTLNVTDKNGKFIVYKSHNKMSETKFAK